MNLNTLVILAIGLAAQAVSGLALAPRDESLGLMARQTCTSPAPAKGSLITVNLILFSDSGCCNEVQTFSEGFELGATGGGFCNTVAGGFSSLRQAVGQDLFGRNLRIFAFTTTDCTGSAGIVNLSNNFVCDTFGAQMKSFIIQ